jgi:peptidoglycan/LPS O-acetylase OafA/YrhL
MALAGIVYLFGVGCLLLIERETALIEHVGLVAFGPVATAQHGYQDSLLRWLEYFNPVINLPAFFCGAVAANIYLLQQTRPMGPQEQTWAHSLVALSLVAVLATHFWLYSALAPTHGFIGRTASMLYIPLVAFLVYGLARYPDSFCARVIGCTLLVKLGETSYSIYLLHAFFGWNARDFYYLKLNPWVLWAIAICCLLAISRCSYLWFERPVQRWLRRQMF